MYIYKYIIVLFGNGLDPGTRTVYPQQKEQNSMVLLSQCGDKSSTASASDMGMVQDYRPRSSTPSGNQTYVVKSPTKLGKTRIHMYT